MKPEPNPQTPAPIASPSPTGLLVVDLQVGFAPPASLVEAILKDIPRHDCVAFTRFSNPLRSMYREVLGWHGDGGELLIDHHPALLLEKTGYGLERHHLEQLRATGIRTWHVAGMETDACVLACCFSLWDGGLRPVVRPELCEPDPRTSNLLAVFRRQFGADDD